MERGFLLGRNRNSVSLSLAGLLLQCCAAAEDLINLARGAAAVHVGPTSCTMSPCRVLRAACYVCATEYAHATMVKVPYLRRWIASTGSVRCGCACCAAASLWFHSMHLTLSGVVVKRPKVDNLELRPAWRAALRPCPAQFFVYTSQAVCLVAQSHFYDLVSSSF